MSDTEDEELVPAAFKNEIMRFVVSEELFRDSQIAGLNEYLTDPAKYRREHPPVPPTRKQRLKTWIGIRRDKLGERLYELATGRHPSEDFGE